jgi:hypothetical protein
MTKKKAAMPRRRQVRDAGVRNRSAAFKNSTTYPPASIQFWLDLAAKLHSPQRWATLIDFGIQLFVAHNLCLEFDSERAARTGQSPGAINGPVTNGSVDKVSYTRDLQGVMDPAAGHWNLTSYGLRYTRMVRMVGAGPVQVGAGAGCIGTGAWPGVLIPGAWS